MKASEEPQDGRDSLDIMFQKMYPNSNLSIVSPAKCTRPSANVKDSVLNDIIQSKIENRALPLALRKRMLYERSIAS